MDIIGAFIFETVFWGLGAITVYCLTLGKVRAQSKRLPRTDFERAGKIIYEKDGQLYLHSAWVGVTGALVLVIIPFSLWGFF